MRRVRLSTLMLLVIIVGLGLGLAVQQRKIARLEGDLRNVSADLRNALSDQLPLTIEVPDTAVRSTGKTPRSARVRATKAKSLEEGVGRE